MQLPRASLSYDSTSLAEARADSCSWGIVR